MDYDVLTKLRDDMSNTAANTSIILKSERTYDKFRLVLSSRTCEKQEDCIYGILGLLRINVDPGLSALNTAYALQNALDKREENTKSV